MSNPKSRRPLLRLALAAIGGAVTALLALPVVALLGVLAGLWSALDAAARRVAGRTTDDPTKGP